MSRINDVRAIRCAVAVALSAGMFVGAGANTARADEGASTSQPSSELDEVLVTARRSAERQEDVPVTLAVLSADALAEQRIVSETDLQAATPGLTVRQTASSNDLSFAIRGQSIDSFSYSAPAVTAYFNEVPTRGQSATGFFDMESIQVLKGPQGTLFGRNATGGAVLYSSAKPKDKFESYVAAGFGNLNNVELEGALNIPLADGYAVRFAARSQDRDGYQHNLVNGDDLASINATTGRASLLIAPLDSGLQNTLVLQYGRYKGTDAAPRMTNANGVNGAPSTYLDPITGTTQPLSTNMRDTYGPGAPFAGVGLPFGFTDLADFLSQQRNMDYYDVYVDRPSTHDAKQRFASNTTTYELSDSLQLKNILGYNKVTSHDPTDIDGSPYQWLTIGEGPGPRDDGYTYANKQWSEEMQLLGNVDQFKYIVGVFFSKEEGYVRIPLCIVCEANGLVPAPPGYIGPYDFTTKNKSKAVFAQGTYALTPRLNLSVGGRYTWEDVSITNGADGLLAAAFTKDDRSDAEPSWLVGLDFRVTDDWMLYINQRGSWRTGGFNGTSGALAAQGRADTFKPEKTYDVEAGAKFAGLLGGRAARLNVAIYDQVVKDAQRSPYVGISAVAGNVEEAEVKGIEFDGSMDLTDWLELGASYSYLDAKFTKETATVAGGTFSFGPYGDSPKNQATTYFRISQNFASLGELAFRGSMYHQSSFYYSNLADTLMPGTKIDGYTLYNARLEWNEIMGTQLSAAAYVQNFTDKEYGTGGFALSAVIGANAELPGTPRLYGAELRMKF